MAATANIKADVLLRTKGRDELYNIGTIDIPVDLSTGSAEIEDDAVVRAIESLTSGNNPH